MRKLSKKSYILIAISLIIITCCVRIYKRRKPITFHKTVNAQIRTNLSDKQNEDMVLRETTVEIDAKMYGGLWRIIKNKIYTRTELKGIIIIDNEEYLFKGSSPGISKNSMFYCYYVNDDDKYHSFILEDLNSVVIYMKKKNS